MILGDTWVQRFSRLDWSFLNKTILVKTGEGKGLQVWSLRSEVWPINLTKWLKHGSEKYKLDSKMITKQAWAPGKGGHIDKSSWL